MGKFTVLKKRKYFLKAAKDISMVTHNVVIQAALNDSVPVSPARIGFTATKKIGKAHIRNFVKRRMRAVMREVAEKYTVNGIDYVLIGRYSTIDCSYEELRKSVIWALRKINKIFKQRSLEKCSEDEKISAVAD
ncbi:MAG: ribonuclease P protein component [Alphaproteobacteria bacterium]|nr:ribonuclease P protein component [Alphaproteobacteria bacterium]